MTAVPTATLKDVSLRVESRRILDSVTLTVGRQEKVAILGPSGAGKTTLLRMLGAQMPPTLGQVELQGQNPWLASSGELRQIRSRVGFIHQSLALVPHLRVWQNVAAGRLGRAGTLGHLRRMTLATRTELRELHATLEQVGVADLLFQRTGFLSGGEQQRVAIARSLYQQPEILLADEPVASVDPARAEQVMELLTQLAQGGGFPLVVSLHDPELAQRHMDRLIGLRHGRVVFDSTPNEITSKAITELYALPSPSEQTP